MLRKPDPQLAVEQAAIPDYVSAGPLAALGTLRGCLLALWHQIPLLRWLLGFLLELLAAIRREQLGAQISPAGSGDEVPTVLLPPPPVLSGFVTPFRDSETIETSRSALATYRQEYRPDPRYPLRVRVARHTGLPAFLTDFLPDKGPDDGDSEVVTVYDAADLEPDVANTASQWLSLRSEILLGKPVPVQDVERELRPDGVQLYGTVTTRYAPDEQEIVETPPLPSSAAAADGRTAHVRYQQWFQSTDGAEWPVFGGNVVVHMEVGGPRISVTNSYFPGLSPGTSFSPQLSALEAKLVAEQVLVAYLDDPGSVGLYWHWLEDLVEARRMEAAPLLATQPACDAALKAFLLALTEYSEQHEGDSSGLQELPQAETAQYAPEVFEQVASVWYRYAEEHDLTWDVHIVPVAGSDDGDLPWILPFAGQYYVAYQVVCSSCDQGWRLFVDAEGGQVLGRPEDLTLHGVLIYPSSGAAASGNKVVDNTFQDATDLLDHGKQKGVIQLPSLGGANDFLITNVAYHTHRLIKHFVEECGADETAFHQHPSLLRACVKKYDDKAMRMCFNPASEGYPKTILFQIDDSGGLKAWEQWKVHHPSLDPEVIYHEVTHGLMYALNDRPFQHLRREEVPFGRALLEGYANYFARSLGSRQEQDAREHWARAAYRTGQGPQDWGKRWALNRGDMIHGEDRLVAPNLYPHNHTSSKAPEVYDVGMIWARALWDVREVLGPERADLLALRASEHVHSWVANFEIAAEGLIAEARKSGNVSDQEITAIIDRFAERRILAERGVQALVQFPDQGGQVSFLVGTDACSTYLHRDGSNTWVLEPWTCGDGTGESIVGVVALVRDPGENAIYLATEDNVYKWPIGQNGLTPLGDWSAEDVPLSMTVANGKPYVGTAGKVLVYNPDDEKWELWGGRDQPSSDSASASSGPSSMPGLSPGSTEPPVGSAGVAVDLTAGDANEASYVYAANMMTPRYRGINVPGSNRWIGTPHIGGTTEALSTAMVVNGGVAYVGTLRNGLWSRQLGSSVTEEWSQIGDAQGIGGGAVLALKPQGTELYAGTSNGLFIGTFDGQNWRWDAEQIGAASPQPTVTAVCPAGNLLLIGTSKGEVWLRIGSTWNKMG